MSINKKYSFKKNVYFYMLIIILIFLAKYDSIKQFVLGLFNF